VVRIEVWPRRGWMPVETVDGKTGYVSSQFIRVAEKTAVLRSGFLYTALFDGTALTLDEGAPLTELPGLPPPEPEPPPSWRVLPFQAALRAGGAPRFYTLNTPLDIEPDGYASFTGAAAFSWQFARFLEDRLGLGVQTELVFAGDEVQVTGAAGSIGVSSFTMEIPLLARLNWYAGEKFFVSAFFGPYAAFPLGGEVTRNGTTEGAALTPFFGLGGGLAGGYKLGPGAVFLDVRYSGDFNFTRMNGAGQYRRSSLPVTAGWEMRF
jgi:hypothetical protein